MKKVPLRSFLIRISEELGQTNFQWTSTVEADPANTIYADMHVRSGSCIVTNKRAVDLYGRVRNIRDMYGSEWIHSLVIKRTFSGPILVMETRL